MLEMLINAIEELDEEKGSEDCETLCGGRNTA